MCSNASDRVMTPGRLLQTLPPVLYYHRDLDGLVAGWAVWSAVDSSVQERIVRCDVQYGEPPPTAEDVVGRAVIVVDFSWSLETLQTLHSAAAELLVIDHHETTSWLADCPWAVWGLEHAGCRLAWDYFHCGEPVPPIVAFVEDRDLWRWQLPGTREYCAALDDREWTFESVDAAAKIPFERLIKSGRVLADYRERIAARIASKAVVGTLAGYSARCVDVGSSSGLVPEVGDAMLKSWPDVEICVLLRWQGGDQWIVSLRSRRGTSVDCGTLASGFGGGGHYHAAGFSCDWQTLRGVVDGRW